MISTDYSEALVEVLEILNYLDDEERKKIPDDIIKFYEENKSKTYIANIPYEEDVSKLKLKDKTREILAGIYLDYLCVDENEKKEYIKKLRQQKYKYEQSLKENYKGKKLFETPKEEIDNTSSQELIIEIKENIFTKILNKLKSLLKKG
ncbi:MAG: hypothetical protein J6A89_07055 [Clostridia bacterium]|nr:hypothetical protein [Clostridia bacterium]